MPIGGSHEDVRGASDPDKYVGVARRRARTTEQTREVVPRRSEQRPQVIYASGLSRVPRSRTLHTSLALPISTVDTPSLERPVSEHLRQRPETLSVAWPILAL